MTTPTALGDRPQPSSRIAGWCAHALEQYAHNRLIRPRALYTGELNRKLKE